MLETFPTPSELKGAVAGTVAYVLFYQLVFLQFQSYSKFYLYAKGKSDDKKIRLNDVKYYSKDKLALVGDRTVGNFVEQAIIFLPLYWLHALFVDPHMALPICGVYLATRSYYPIVFMMRFPSLLLSTVPGYCVVLYMTYRLITEVYLA